MKNILIVLFVLIGWNAQSQDIHFSQFWAAPMNYNPGLSGAFDGEYRVTANQRTQWRSVTIPYSTFGGSFDSNALIKNQPIGTSIAIYQDRAGDSRLNTLAFDLGASYIHYTKADSSERFSGGLQLGIIQKNIDYSALNYDNQWNGFAFDPSLNPNESFARNSRLYASINVGLAYFKQIDDEKSINAGLSVYNLNGPKQSFFDNDEIRLDPRINIHSDMTIKLNDEWDAKPAMLLSLQGTFTEWILGGIGEYYLIKNSSITRSVYGGVFYRTRDAGYLTIGMQYDQWRAGISYDINTSNLRPASNGRGGLEFSVIYIWKKLKRPAFGKIVCPDFL